MKRSRATHRFGGRRSDSTQGKDKAAYLQGKRKRQHKITGMLWAPSLRRLHAISPRLTCRVRRSVSDFCAWLACIISTQTQRAFHLVVVKKQTTTTKKTMSVCWKYIKESLVIFSICYRKLVQKMCDREKKKKKQPRPSGQFISQGLFW